MLIYRLALKFIIRHYIRNLFSLMILITPISLLVASALKLIPVPFLIAEMLASNIGGTATLIGDLPNILIGSAAGNDFLTYRLNMAPIAAIVYLVFLGPGRILFKNELQTDTHDTFQFPSQELPIAGPIFDTRS